MQISACMYASSTRVLTSKFIILSLLNLFTSKSFRFQICSLPNPFTSKSFRFQICSLPNPFTSKSFRFQIRSLSNLLTSKFVHFQILSLPNPLTSKSIFFWLPHCKRAKIRRLSSCVITCYNHAPPPQPHPATIYRRCIRWPS